MDSSTRSATNSRALKYGYKCIDFGLFDVTDTDYVEERTNQKNDLELGQLRPTTRSD